ncbi:TetR/AcrR family transcriptional regulator [Lactobacillus sp. XV13L]|nr:TetR/AcrR family transcriptional regulator [Lactobacillus sp. XV13L]
MVKTTFTNLSASKKDLIRQALLHEFSSYPLQKAQVARIVKDAGIARGAFYKYFTDLTDAYLYLYHCAMQEIHAGFKRQVSFKPQVYYQAVVEFIEQTQSSKYARLVRMHVLFNENTVAEPFPSDALRKLDSQTWSAMVLSHAAIHMVLENPAQKEVVLDRFKAGLELLDKGVN